jgi:hypothetical protein
MPLMAQGCETGRWAVAEVIKPSIPKVGKVSETVKLDNPSCDEARAD